VDEGHPYVEQGEHSSHRHDIGAHITRVVDASDTACTDDGTFDPGRRNWHALVFDRREVDLK